MKGADILAYYDNVPFTDNAGNTHYPRTKYNSVYNAAGTERLDNKLAAMDSAIASKANLSALGSYAAKSTSVTATLTAAGWNGASAPYTQTVSVTGATASNNIIFDLGMGITASQLEAGVDAMLKATSQGTGTVTITAFGDKPAVDIPVQFIIIG